MLVGSFELRKGFIQDACYGIEVVLLKLVNSRWTRNIAIVRDSLRYIQIALVLEDHRKLGQIDSLATWTLIRHLWSLD